MLRVHDAAAAQLLRIHGVAHGFRADGHADVALHQRDDTGDRIVQAENVALLGNVIEPVVDLILHLAAGRDNQGFSGELSQLHRVLRALGQGVIHAHEGDPGLLFYKNVIIFFRIKGLADDADVCQALFQFFPDLVPVSAPHAVADVGILAVEIADQAGEDAGPAGLRHAQGDRPVGGILDLPQLVLGFLHQGDDLLGLLL